MTDSQSANLSLNVQGRQFLWAINQHIHRICMFKVCIQLILVIFALVKFPVNLSISTSSPKGESLAALQFLLL